ERKGRDEEESPCGAEDDPLAEPAQGDDGPPLRLAQGRPDAAQEERTPDPDGLQAPAQDALAQRLEINLDVRELGHKGETSGFLDFDHAGGRGSAGGSGATR